MERAYYLAPDGKTGSDAFAVMREGMQGKIGIGKLALYGREYLAAVKPKGRGMVMYTLHHAGELRTMEDIDELNTVPATVKPQEIGLAHQVIETFNAPLDLATYHDEYVEGLQKVIEAKIAGQEIVAPSEPARPRVVNLMDALKKSLDTVSAGKKKTAKASVGSPTPNGRVRRASAPRVGCVADFGARARIVRRDGLPLAIWASG